MEIILMEDLSDFFQVLLKTLSDPIIRVLLYVHLIQYLLLIFPKKRKRYVKPNQTKQL